MSKPWDRQKGEPNLWYSRFDLYYRPQPLPREVKVAFDRYKEAEAPDCKAKNASRHWYENSKKWHWKERAEAWDKSIHDRRIEKEESALEEMLDRHIRAAMLLMGKSLKFMSEKDIDSWEVALRAIKLAFDEERKARGLPTHLLEIMDLTDEELLERYREVMHRVSGKDNGREPNAG